MCGASVPDGPGLLRRLLLVPRHAPHALGPPGGVPSARCALLFGAWLAGYGLTSRCTTRSSSSSRRCGWVRGAVGGRYSPFMPDTRSHEQEQSWRRGLLYGFAAYGSWGFMPVYIKAVRAAPVLEVLSHRVFWAFLLLLVALAWRRDRAGRSARGAAHAAHARAAGGLDHGHRGQLARLHLGGRHGHVLEASLGYFINPLVNVLFGVAPPAREARPPGAHRGRDRRRGRALAGDPRPATCPGSR